MSSIFIALKEFKPIPEHPGYFVSWDGVVASCRPGNRRQGKPRILKQHPDKDGYMRFTQKVAGNKQYGLVHLALVAAWHGPKPFPEAQCRHLDGNNQRNVGSNLAWGTSGENGTDQAKHGSHAGHRNGQAKLTEADVLRLRTEALNKPIQTLVDENTQWSKFAVWAAITGYTWKHLPGAIQTNRRCTKGGYKAGVRLREKAVQI